MYGTIKTRENNGKLEIVIFASTYTAESQVDVAWLRAALAQAEAIEAREAALDAEVAQPAEDTAIIADAPVIEGVRWDVLDGRITVGAPYDDSFKAAVKALGAEWHAASKMWAVAQENKTALYELVNKHYAPRTVRRERLTFVIDKSNIRINQFDLLAAAMGQVKLSRKDAVIVGQLPEIVKIGLVTKFSGTVTVEIDMTGHEDIYPAPVAREVVA